MRPLLADIVSHGHWAVFGAAFVSFATLYIIFAGGGWWLSRSLLPAWKIGAVVDPRPLREGQIAKEAWRSLVSIATFGGYGVLTVEIFRAGHVNVAWEPSWLRTGIDIVLLFVWNEAHFFACHRLLHTRWLYQHVHRIHHESVTPTPFSVYSFHWLESLLLGSVMITAMLFGTFSIWALLALPVFSILFNTIGHWNYNLFAGTARRSASVEHSHHHLRVAGNYGFYLPFLDRLFRTFLRTSV
jgi:sterol desaturase/sphingolipid hydroxylase (fatty acid hydroxylase superfamily)